jgi:hypothetical protein
VPIQDAARQFVFAAKISRSSSAGFKLDYQLLDFPPTSLPPFLNFIILVHALQSTKIIPGRLDGVRQPDTIDPNFWHRKPRVPALPLLAPMETGQMISGTCCNSPSAIKDGRGQVKFGKFHWGQVEYLPSKHPKRDRH